MMKPRVRKFSIVLAVATFSILCITLVAYADNVFKNFEVHPSVFDPFHTNLVSSEWEPGAGCPTDAAFFVYPSNTATPFTDAACPTGDSNDHNNLGLVLVKTGPTSNNAAAQANLTGVKGISLTELGFDIRSGGHCGAGAPRFNIQATDGFHFMGGCANGTVTISSPAWKRVRIDPTNPAQAFPVLTPGATIVSIQIVFDEGQDTGPDFSGLAVLDNIEVNGVLEGNH